ncbi:MAG: hypothetical protein ACOH2F_12185 [Cellulomonas sp.]
MRERAGSYRLVLPPTWVMLPVGDASQRAIDTLLDEQFGHQTTPRDLTNRRRLTESLRALVAGARASGGLDVIFPLVIPWQVPLSAGIVMSELRSTAPSDLAVAALMGSMQRSRPGSTLAETQAGVALREVVDHPTAVEVDAEALTALRTVYYTWPQRDAPGSFLISALTISGQAIAEFAPIVDALTELNDVMMQTLVWS